MENFKTVQLEQEELQNVNGGGRCQYLHYVWTYYYQVYVGNPTSANRAQMQSAHKAYIDCYYGN